MTRAEKRAVQRERALKRSAFVMTHTYADERGLRRCKKHSKVYYGTEGQAHTGLIAYLRHPQSDPGAVVYGCQYTHGWHIGHPGGWKSLGRLIDEAEGVFRMAEQEAV